LSSGQEPFHSFGARENPEEEGIKGRVPSRLATLSRMAL
jgi:hypothetical protein